MVAGTFKRHVRVAQTTKGFTKSRSIGISDREVVQAGSSWRGSGSVLTLPRVQADVMVISAGT